MADRSVVVRLRAEVAGFQQAMLAAGDSSARAQADLERMSANGSTSLGRLTTSAQTHRDAWEKSGVALLGFGAAAVAGVGLAIKTYADFSSQMAQVQSLSHATGDEMASLTTAALTMGQSIGFSASEVAAGEIEMVKAGISVKDILGGAMVGALTLAAAGQIDVADATEIATIAMTQFGLAGKDVPHIADLLSAGADKALGGVSELGWALKSGGLVAHQFGLSLDDTVGTLSLFAQNGLMGEAAGTDLRQMLLKLAAPSKTAAGDMKQLGMNIYDTSGHFVGITSLAGQLHDKMQNLSEAERNAMEAHIFGARSIVGANILYQAGAAGVQGWIDAVNDSGFAARQAAGKMDSMSGDVKKLQAAWETGMIQMGSTSDSFVRPTIQGITSVIQNFDKLPESTKGMILGFAAVAGGAALLGGAFLTLAPRVLDTINGFKQLATDLPNLTSHLATLGKTAGVAAGAMVVMAGAAAISNSMMPATASVDATTQAILKMNSTTDSVDALFKAFDDKGHAAAGIAGIGDALHRLNNMSWIDSLNKFANDIGPVQDQLRPAREQIDKIDGSLGNLVNSGNTTQAANGFRLIAAEAQKQGVSLETTAKSFPQYIASLQAQANAQKVTLQGTELMDWAMGKVPASMMAAGDSIGAFMDSSGKMAPVSKETAKALDAIGLSADGTTVDLDKLVKSMEQAGLIQISADQALRDYYASLDAVDASVIKNGKSLDIHTEKGRANRKALDDVASAGLAMVQANAKNGASQEELSGNLTTTYNDLLANYKVFGITGDAADTMARQVMGIPKNVPIDTAIQNYADSMLKINNIGTAVDQLNGKTAHAFIDVTTNANGAIADYANAVARAQHLGGKAAYATGGLVGFATGGMVGGFPGGGLLSGPGTGTSDSMVARVSNGEFIQPTKSVQKYGVHFMEQVRAGTYQPTAPTFQPVGNYSSSSAAVGSAPVTHIWNITGQENPVATTHEVLRRAVALKV